MNPQNKRALVFGGTSGMGLSVCKRLVNLGAEVVAISREPAKAEGLLPEEVSLAACDARVAQDVEAIFAAHAPVSILVNTAPGGTRAAGPFNEMDMDAFKRSFDKLWGYANTVRFGLEHMSEDASIVLLTGSPAKRSLPGQVALGAVGGAADRGDPKAPALSAEPNPNLRRPRQRLRLWLRNLRRLWFRKPPWQ